MSDDRITPRPASTVVLAREQGSGLQVYLLKRSVRSGFFPGSYVFPGGTVDREDRGVDFWLSHVDLDPAGIEGRFGKEPGVEEVLGYGVAAIRETFEEAGALLARNGSGALLNPGSLRKGRAAGRLGKGWFKKQAGEGEWALALSSLFGWSHWITPEPFSPRFDTRFFLAAVPEGQECSPDMEETTRGLWVEPQQALEGNLRGEIPLSPPTLVTLQELIGHARLRNLEEASLKRGWGEPRIPRLIGLSGGAVIVEPWDPMFHEEISIDEKSLEGLILAAGRPFSRIWLHKGIWRPVGV